MNKIKLPEKFAKWHGIDRQKVPWYPTINENKCIGCKLCFVSCGRNVFDFDYTKNMAIVENKYFCLVGCSTCATICPVEAISFPNRELIQKIEREEKILLKIKNKAKEKKSKLDIEKTRKIVMDALSHIKAKIDYEVAGNIIESNLVSIIENILAKKPADIVDIKIEIASLKGCWLLKAPSLLKFSLISTELEDISKISQKIDEQIAKTGNVLLSKR